MSGSAPSFSRRFSPALALAVVAMVCLAPFASEAFRIDDTLFLSSARQIQAHPADPFGTTVNWYGTESPLSTITENPPGACYYIALAAGIAGWGETALHLAFMVPAVMAVLGTFFLARSLCPRPAAAALVALLTPAFLVSSTTVMCDTPMLALWLWAIVLWRRGLEKRENAALALSAVLMAMAALTKYFGACVVPLLLVYTLLRERRGGLWLAFLSIPLLALAGYDWVTAAKYGHGMAFEASRFVTSLPRTKSLPARGMIALAFAGGCVAPVFFFAPLLCSRKCLGLGVLLAVGAGAVLCSIGVLGGFPLRAGGAARWLVIAQISIFAVCGTGILALALNDWLRCRDADSAFLALWVVGTFVFAWDFNWTVNGRSILPLVPAVAILVMRQIDRRSGAGPAKGSGRILWPFIPAGLLAFAVVGADSLFANSARAAAAEIHSQYATDSRTVWFQGHWGFQYYMEARGARPVDFKHPEIKPGDLMVVPSNNTGIRAFSQTAFTPIGRVERRSCRWLATMNNSVGAGFYTDSWGPLPFAFGPVSTEAYDIWQFQPPQYGLQ